MLRERGVYMHIYHHILARGYRFDYVQYIYIYISLGIYNPFGIYNPLTVVAAGQWHLNCRYTDH